MLHSVSGIQHLPQLPLRNKKDFIRERVLHLRARRETAHVDESLIRSIWAFHKTRLAWDRRAVGIIAFGWFCRRGRCRRRCWRLRTCFGVFRRRVWIKRLLCRLVFCTRFGGILRGGMPRAGRPCLVIGASRDKKCGKQRQ